MSTQRTGEAKTVSQRRAVTGMEAAASAAYALSDAAMIFPITPASHMAETVESWAAAGRENFFGHPVVVKEMQSEKGVAGALHGCLAGGALATTMTASQGLMLMIPNMYKISGEMLPGVFHVTTRSLAAHALSIFGDHQDLMAVRATGVAMLGSASVQECHDLSWVAHLAAIEGSLPFVHFFDGFRTSDEVQTIDLIDPAAVRPLVNWQAVSAFRHRAMDPERPAIRGTAQNPDIYFQNREAPNAAYDALPAIVQKNMDALAKVTGRHYHLFDYVGAPDAERVVVTMASSCETVEAVVRDRVGTGEKVGLVKVRLYRPFSAEHLLAAIPTTARIVCALDRTKEPGSLGEPLFLDVQAALAAARPTVRVIGGRYGLSSKEFAPAHALAVFENMATSEPKTRFTVGITDDVTHLSLPVRDWLPAPVQKLTQAVFYGFGSDGTVSANKVAARIVSDAVGKFVQEYSWFDSKKSGGLTISYMRFGDAPVREPWLITQADYLACHKDIYVKRGYRMLDRLRDGGTFVLNAPWTSVRELDAELPAELRRAIAAKHADFYVIDAAKLAADEGLGPRINMIMQTAFFRLTKVMDFDTARQLLKENVARVYASKGADVVARDQKAIDAAADALVKIGYPKRWADATDNDTAPASDYAAGAGAAPAVRLGSVAGEDAFIENIFRPMDQLRGNELPVSALSPDGIVPPGSAEYEKRCVAYEIPSWDATKCVECYECSLVCSHAAIRPYVATAAELNSAPAAFDTKPATLKELSGMAFRIQVYPEDCVGCGSCADNCPGKALAMTPLHRELETQKANLAFAQANISLKDSLVPADSIPGTQLQKPLLEFSGCCGGCGETPYVKLLTQLFGDRLIIANATGCSSIWGAYMPSMPYTVNTHGHGPAWGNSLFEDNGEFGYGIAKAVKVRRAHLVDLVKQAVGEAVDKASNVLIASTGTTQAGSVGGGFSRPSAASGTEQSVSSASVATQGGLKSAPTGDMTERAKELLTPAFSPATTTLLSDWLAAADDADAAYDLGQAAQRALKAERMALPAESAARALADEILDYGEMFGKKSVWAVGGDGWAYDIGYGGLDEVLASGENINVLVLDTEGYSNTGGEMSKATELSSVSGFTLDGKPTPRKNLGRMMMQYGYVYVAQVCLGADMEQTIRALREAESYDGPSIVIALCPCISWGIKGGMSTNLRVAREGVRAGYWPLFRFNPALAATGADPLTVDPPAPDDDLDDFLSKQDRFTSLTARDPQRAATLHSELSKDLAREYTELEREVKVYEP
ncbi:pyruvate:ferredoxin (flavodoxin) oxidoreductase [Adlercreutzia sp. R7]|uniref:Pyruvate:ferredoxin (Flavodoxin) oxidoreductase n=1 Tax=Adlercreutzia wanghongyangiae TaxID=3111451 RepID=A0ABU6IIJ7_9ACTN|nr:pyruvate:ferredoxin (flavodoxin) oxidoreductase [Adlercreutzia sp. R7]